LIRAAGRVEVELGEHDEALRNLARLPDDPGLFVWVAQRMYDQGFLHAALSMAERARSVDPLDEIAGYWAGRIREEIGVLGGEWQPGDRSPPRGVERTPGRIVHMVGRSLPHAQVGYTIRTQAIVRSQKQVGLDPQVITSIGFPPGALPSGGTHEVIDGIDHFRLLDGGPLPTGMRDKLDRAHAVARPLVEALQPSLLHAASDYLNALLALALGADLQIPVVYEVRGFWEESWLSRRDEAISKNSDQYLLRRDIETRCMHEADHVITLGDTMKRDMISRGIPEDKITVIPNAVDLDSFVPASRDDRLGEEVGLRKNDLVVGYISSLIAYEGIEYLIRATALLKPDFPNLRLLIVGEGPERIALETEAGELLPPNTAIFTGSVPHEFVASYYGLIDVFVVPRRPDRVSELVTPLKPYEAMAMELPVVVSSVSALREMIEPGVSGLTFEAGSAASLAEVLRPLLEEEHRRLELGRNAREWVAQERTWERNTSRYSELYRTLGVVP
jgi:PEP-CTERM/exosortase A-associated glycosyltransferase